MVGRISYGMEITWDASVESTMYHVCFWMHSSNILHFSPRESCHWIAMTVYRAVSVGNKLPFGVVFEAEGWDVGFTEVAENLYFFNTKTNGDIPNFVNLSASTHYTGNECVRKMADELILDLEIFLDDWAAFSVFYYEEKEQKIAIKKNKKELQKKIKTLKRLLNKYRRKNS